MDLNIADYLLKPISFDHFSQIIQKVFNTQIVIKTKELQKEMHNSYIFIRADREMIKINFNNTLYIESLSNYVNVFSENSITIYNKKNNILFQLKK